MVIGPSRGERFPRPPLGEARGAGPFAGYAVAGRVMRARSAELSRLTRKLGRLPAGYITFVTKLGEGMLEGRVRVYGPGRILGDLASWRARLEQCWYADALWLLPRGGTRARPARSRLRRCAPPAGQDSGRAADAFPPAGAMTAVSSTAGRRAADRS